MHRPLASYPREQSLGFEALNRLEHAGSAQRPLFLDQVGDVPFGARLVLPNQPEHANFQLSEGRKFLGHPDPLG